MKKLKFETEIKLDVFIKFFLFLINPFFGLTYSLRNIKTRSTFIIFFLFCLLFGVSFIVSDNGLDSYEYLKVFEEVKLYSPNEFYESFVRFIKGDPFLPDFYIQLTSYITSRFSDNYHLLFLLLSFVFSYFMIGSLKFFLLSSEFNKSIFICYILLFLFLFNQIFNINGARFWTANWVTVYIILNLFLKKNYKSLLWLIILPLLHSTGILNILLILIILILRNKYNLAIVILIISFIFSSFFSILTNLFIDILPVAIKHKLITYTDPSVIENRKINTGILKLIFNKILFIYINIFVYILIKNKKIIKNTTSLLVVSILLLSFANFTIDVPSLGSRYIQLTYPLLALIWLNNRKQLIKYNLFIMLLPICFAISIWEYINLYLKVLDTLFFVSPPIYTFYYYLF